MFTRRAQCDRARTTTRPARGASRPTRLAPPHDTYTRPVAARITHPRPSRNATHRRANGARTTPRSRLRTEVAPTTSAAASYTRTSIRYKQWRIPCHANAPQHNAHTDRIRNRIFRYHNHHRAVYNHAPSRSPDRAASIQRDRTPRAAEHTTAIAHVAPPRIRRDRNNTSARLTTPPRIGAQPAASAASPHATARASTYQHQTAHGRHTTTPQATPPPQHTHTATRPVHDKRRHDVSRPHRNHRASPYRKHKRDRTRDASRPPSPTRPTLDTACANR